MILVIFIKAVAELGVIPATFSRKNFLCVLYNYTVPLYYLHPIMPPILTVFYCLKIVLSKSVLHRRFKTVLCYYNVINKRFKTESIISRFSSFAGREGT